MVITFVILVLSILLLLYWFRYTCSLLIRNSAEEIRAGSSAVPSGFTFGNGQMELDRLHRALERDYQVLTYLVQHASGIELANFEERMLVWDYRLLQVWYAVTKTVAPERARRALAEMAAVLRLLAGRIGQRAGLQTQA